MNNFVFWNPTKIIFGRETLPALVEELREREIRKVLLIYGQGSILKNGIYEQITHLLNQNGVEMVELPGIQPNPVLSGVEEGIRLCLEHSVQALMPVGGGSVYDTAKAIAAGVPYAPGSVWDLFRDRVPVPPGALPIFGVLTTSATGTEMNCNAVITHE